MPSTGRSRLLAIIGIGSAVVLIAVVAFLLGRSGTHPVATPATTPAARAGSSTAPVTPPTSRAASATSAGEDAAPPSGCLGGQDRTVATVLAAQHQASHSAFGAADFAATYFRWGYRYPYPTASQVRVLHGIYAAGKAASLEASAIRAYSGTYAAPAGGGVTTGTPYYLSMASGLWITSEGSTPDTATVSVEGNYVIDDVFSPTEQEGITITFVWQRRGWRVESFARPNLSKLSAGGTTFTAGC